MFIKRRRKNENINIEKYCSTQIGDFLFFLFAKNLKVLLNLSICTNKRYDILGLPQE